MAEPKTRPTALKSRAWLQSIAAEHFGLLTVLSVVAFFPFFAGLVGFALPSDRKLRPAPLPAATPSPSGAAD